MNRIDRLFGYILALEGSPAQTAGALARRFEISRRTVYRDLVALSELGVPLLSIPGRGYSLVPGYHLPPVMFTTEEASVLALAGGLFRYFVAHESRAALDTALRKVDLALPEGTRSAVAEVRQRVSVMSWPHNAVPLDSELPKLIQRAMSERHQLRFTYHTGGGAASRERTVDPYVLVFYAGDWHMLAFCHRQGEVRQFRLSRIEAPQILDDRFDMPSSIDARDFWTTDEAEGSRERVATVRFPKSVARRVRERRHYTWDTERETEESLVITLRAGRWEEVLPWLLTWGRQVAVVEPPELRALLAAEAKAIWAAHDQPVESKA